MNKILNVACLVRVSHEEQVKHGYSLDAQKESLQNWIDENGHKVPVLNCYIDIISNLRGLCAPVRRFKRLPR